MKLDSVFIQCKLSKKGELVTKVMADGQSWRVITIPLDDFKQATVWDKIKAEVEKANPPAEEAAQYPCPSCGNNRYTYLRQYKGKYFCGFCGAHLRRINDRYEVR